MPLGTGAAERKRLVAQILIQQAGDLLEHWDEVPYTEDLDLVEAREWIAGWLKNLPGTAWDTRLDHPTERNRS
jgi:hypothetical protein